MLGCLALPQALTPSLALLCPKLAGSITFVPISKARMSVLGQRSSHRWVMAYLWGTKEISGRWTLPTRIQKAASNSDVGQRFRLGVILNHKNIQNKSLLPMARGNKIGV